MVNEWNKTEKKTKTTKKYYLQREKMNRKKTKDIRPVNQIFALRSWAGSFKNNLPFNLYAVPYRKKKTANKKKERPTT